LFHFAATDREPFGADAGSACVSPVTFRLFRLMVFGRGMSSALLLLAIGGCTQIRES
jgi:hypothetical protein